MYRSPPDEPRARPDANPAPERISAAGPGGPSSVVEPYGSVETVSREEAGRDARERRWSGSAQASEARSNALGLTSSAFADGGTIPTRYTMDGENLSPPLRWSDPPDETQSFALLCEDLDASAGALVHWLAWNIDPRQRSLPEGYPDDADDRVLRQGQNEFGATGYRGPSQASGAHHRYVFHLYALDTRLPELSLGATRLDFERELEHHVLAEGTLTGVYGHE